MASRIHTINLAAPPQVLTVAPGDKVRVVTEFDYVGPELKDARMISAIWHPPFHDEIVRGNKTFTIPSSPPPGNHITVTMDLLVPSGEAGTDYGLYSSVRDVPGPDIYTDYYANIITIVEVAPEFKGTISKKELEYNESRGAIPVSNVPQDKRGLVHIWGRNDMAISQKLGIHWIVKDPNGIVVEDYQDWEFGTTGTGATHEFIGGRFDLNKAGTWTISISLAMNPTAPLTVASYAGVLCTVAVAPPSGISLKARGNFVVYTGRAQASLVALDSIAPYLDPGKAVWYWNNYIGAYEIVQTPGIPVYDRTDMVPYGCYWIQVTQNCTWTYGADATPPDRVQLFGGRWNSVGYSGPVQRSLDALASIAPYLEGAVWYWNNQTYAWELMETPRIPIYDRNIMVPNGYYNVRVTQDCIWRF